VAATTQIDNVIRRAAPVWSGKDRAGRQNVYAAHFYDVPITVDGVPAEIRVVVRESNTGKRYYDHFELKSESPAPGDTRSVQEDGEAFMSPRGDEQTIHSDSASGQYGNHHPSSISLTLANRTPSGSNSGNAIAGIADPSATHSPLTAARAGDDLETRAGLALLEEKGDLTVPVELETGEVAHVSLQDALREADAESAYANKNSFDAAVQCALTRGP